MAVVGLEQPPKSLQDSGYSISKRAPGRARRAPDNNLADDDTPPPTIPDLGSDPLLACFLDAWNRLSDADRVRLVEEAERKAE